MVSPCLAKICARKNQLPGYHPKQVSNFTSSPYYACPESSLHSWAHFFVFLWCWDVLSVFKVSVFQLPSNWPPWGLFTVTVTLKHQRLLWLDACAHWHIFNCREARSLGRPFVTSNWRNQGRYHPSIFMGLRGGVFTLLVTQTWDLGFQLVKIAVHFLVPWAPPSNLTHDFFATAVLLLRELLL